MKNELTSAVFQRKIRVFSIKLIHFVMTIILFAIAWMFFRYHSFQNFNRIGFRYNYFIILGYTVILYFFIRTYSAYLLGYTRIRNLAFTQMLSQLFSMVVIYFLVSLGWNHFYNPSALILALVLQFVLDILWSYQASGYFFKIYPPKKTILIYRNKLDRKRFGNIQGKPSERLYTITDELMYDGSFFELKDRLAGYEAIFVAGINSRCRNGILKYCKENAIPGFFLPHVGDVIMQEAIHIKSFDSPVLFAARKVIDPEYALVKRAFDIVASALGLVILSPVLLITAIAIKAYDKGPVFYKQVRLTKDGRHFKIIKFRSMRVDAEKDGVARLSTGDNDDRITPIGRWVRKCRLDELPQLWNILVGEMSVVGPRPERPEIAEQYYQVMPDFQLRLQVKAGLTGYAQVYGKYNTDPYEKLEFDLMYIKNMNVFTDLKLMFATFAVLFSSESTMGVDSGSVTALDLKDRDTSM